VTDIWNAPAPDANYDRHQAERTAVFNTVANRDNWKLPIAAWIEADQFNACRQAVMFFTGSELKITKTRGGQVFVEAAGYYQAVGA
jgi:hypothetical protein